MPSERSPSAAKERAELMAAQLQRLADAANKFSAEMRALYPRTRWQRICGWFSYRAEVIAMHLRGDFRRGR